VNRTAVDEPLAPGLHVYGDGDPLTKAKQLAVDFQGDLCETPEEVRALVAELRAYPPLGADEIAVVRALADRVAAARRIVEGTLDRAAAAVGERLADTGSGVAVHPSAVRDRAAAVVTARERLRQAEDRLAAAQHDDGPAAVSVEPAPAPVEAAPEEPEPVGRRRRWFGRGRAARRRDEEDTSESTSLLHQMAAATDEAFGARRAVEARSELLVLLQAQRDRAVEDVRVAERSWSDLAGDDPVEDVERVVQRFDPQHQQARVLAQDSVGVRAVAPLLDRALGAWAEGWASLGQDPPNGSSDPMWVERLAERLGRPVVLVAAAVAGLEEVAAAAPTAPLLVVEELAS
jgi:hypothetical protein